MTEPEREVDFTSIYIDDEIVDRVKETLRSTRWVKGPEVERFEEAFAEVCGVEHGVAVSSGTAALLLALQSLGIGDGDQVFVPGHTFFATVSPVLSLGAEPVFVDIDPRTYTIAPDDLREKVAEARSPAAVMPVHIYGHPAEMDAITGVADEHDINVVEDACQAHLARRGGTTAGTFGDAGCFSFYPSKNMAVGGDGGMLVTDQKAVAKRAAALRDHGRTPDGVHAHLGLNYRMDEMNAVVGQEQLSHLPDWSRARNEAAEWYDKRLRDVPEVVAPTETKDAFHVYHLYVVQVPDRKGLRAHLEEQGVDTGIHYKTPAHQHPAVKERVSTNELTETERLYGRNLSLPMHPRIEKEEVNYVCDLIEDYFR